MVLIFERALPSSFFSLPLYLPFCHSAVMVEHAWHAKRFKAFSFSVIVLHVAAFMAMRPMSRTVSCVVAGAISAWILSQTVFSRQPALTQICFLYSGCQQRRPRVAV
jgi:hypothetical protein